MSAILAIQSWPTNAEMIADCARLGYLRAEWPTLDVTYGEGVFWQAWKPDHLVGCDLDPAKSPVGYSVDFSALPWPDRSWHCVVFDPPYKLNGTPDPTIDARYGVHRSASRQERLDLIVAGAVECARVLGDGFLLAKCQDQVVGGKKRWQTDLITEALRAKGLGKVDRLDFLSYRPQPDDRRQVHAHCCSSQLLIFKRGWGL